MWHILLCTLLALPALSEFDLREKSEKPVLTEQKCESCATCGKCAKDNATNDKFDGNRATEPQRLCATETRSEGSHRGFPRLSRMRGLRAVHGPCRGHW